MKKLLFIFLLLGIVTIANADDGMLNATYISSIFNLAETVWVKIAVNNSIKIFTVLWAFETFTQCIFHKFFDLTKMKELFRFLAVRIAFMGFFEAILMSPVIYKGIIDYFAYMGQYAMAGFPDKHAGYTGLDAGWIWHQYAQWYTTDLPALSKGAGWNVGSNLVLVALQLMYFLCTLYISFLIILMTIEATCIIFGALILTGFAGSDWTKKWWDSYLGMVVSMGLKIMLFCFLYAGLQKILAYHPMQGGFVDGVLGFDVWTQVVNCLICTLALGIIPGKIAGAISSAASGNTGGEAIAGFLSGYAIAKNVATAPTKIVAGTGKVTNSVGKIMDKIGGSSGGDDKGSSGGKSQQPTADSKDKSEFLNNSDKKTKPLL